LSSIQQTYANNASVIISTDIEDIIIAAKQSFYVGIIINELVTNSYKYAFANSKKGEIRIEVWKHDNSTLGILVQDTGKGLPEGVVENEDYGFGLKLVTIFVQQYRGNMEISGNEGTSVRIMFPLLPIPDAE
jgi:two-component system, sensor histidine kinase PdtaS